MSYMGEQPIFGQYPTQLLSGNGVLTSFTLTYSPASPSTLLVTISGVKQQATAYSVTDTTIDFGAGNAPPSGTNNIEILYLGQRSDVGTVADDSITLAKMASLARGKLIVGDSSGDPSALTVGSADQVLTSDGTDAAWAAVSAGKVLQVLTVEKQDTFSTNSTSFVDITDLTLTITPSATTSKIYVTGMLNLGQHGGTGYIWIQLLRASTAICVPTSYSSRAPTLVGTGNPQDHTLITAPISYVDSPSTSSATVYKLQMRSQNVNLQYINRSYTDTDNNSHPRSASSLTVMEIGA